MSDNKVRCFADEKYKCAILTHKRCKSCNFYKTVEDRIKDYEESNERLASLPEQTQNYIAEKYFRGRKHWLFKKDEVWND